MSSTKKIQLTKSVLDMKFMKKTKERIEKERENLHNHENMYSGIITNEMKHATGNYISEASFIFCEELLEGRLSFKGMNPEIERLMELENEKKQPDSEMEKDISDTVLAAKFAAFKKQKRPIQDSPSQCKEVKRKRK